MEDLIFHRPRRAVSRLLFRMGLATFLTLPGLSRRLFWMSWVCRRTCRNTESPPWAVTETSSSPRSKITPTVPRTGKSKVGSEPSLSRREPPVSKTSNRSFLDLETKELELAFETLVNPEQDLPDSLQHLTPEEWMCVENVLEILLSQRERAGMH